MKDDGTKLLTRSVEVLGVAGGAKLRLMRKHGRILCALPEERELAFRTLGLYCPQRPLGRIAASMVGFSYRLGLAGLVLRDQFDCPGDEGELEQCGLLLGSPAHPIERSVALIPSASGYEVVKIAFGTAGQAVLDREARMLEGLEGFGVAPRLRAIESSEDVTLLRMDYASGARFQSDSLTPVLGLLQSWLKEGEARSLGKFPEWGIIESELANHGMGEAERDRLADLGIAVALRHGDFTRWNLRITGDKLLKVHDWERGAFEGVSGFDLVYYLVQDALLVKRLPPKPLVEHVLRILRSPEPSFYLEACGWTGNEFALLQVVFAFSNASGYEDHSALLHQTI